MSKEIQTLQADHAQLQSKLKELIEWLGKNTKSPYFMKVASDRNLILLKISNAEYKIKQLKAGLPKLGEPDFPEINIFKENPNQFKTL